MAAPRLPKIGPFVFGMDNRRPDTEMRIKEGEFLRSAINVDVDHLGHIKRRRGTERAVTGDDCHSLWAPRGADAAYFVDGDRLLRLDSSAAAATVRGDLTPGRRMSYAALDDTIYYTNGVECGRIAGGADRPWGPPLPSLQPSATVLPGAGALPVGRYRLYYVFVDAEGQESGASEVMTATVDAPARGELAGAGHRNDDLGGSAIRISGLPAELPAGVSHMALYMTAPGGDAFLRAAVVGAGATTAVTMPPAAGALGRTLGLVPMPAGDIVRIHNGRMLVAKGDTLFVSQPYALALHDPISDFIQFDGPITLVMPCGSGGGDGGGGGSGVYVCADKTYWLAADIVSAEPRTVLPYGGVAGSDVPFPDGEGVCWMSPDGLVRGLVGAEIENLQHERVRVGSATHGASLLRETDGMKQIVAALAGGSTGGMAARSFMDAEVIRKGTQL